MVISIINQKGGVGKTTTAVNLGTALAEAGHSVLVVDLDPQCNASAMLGVRDASISIFDVLANEDRRLRDVIRATPIPNLSIAPGHPSLAGIEQALQDAVGREMILKEALAPIADQYDAILIDNGPTLGIAPVMSLSAAHLAMIPLQCERLALEGLVQALKTIGAVQRRINPRLEKKILLTMLDRRINNSKEMVQAVQQKFGAEVCATIIGRSSKLDTGTGSVLQHAPSSTAAQDYRALALEVAALPAFS